MEEMKWLTGRWVPAPCVSLKSSIGDWVLMVVRRDAFWRPVDESPF